MPAASLCSTEPGCYTGLATEREDTMTWTEPYRGLPWTATGVGDNPPDAADVLAARSKRGGNMVLVPMGVLVGMASRLDSQSRALVAAQGGLGASLGPSDLAAYTAAQEAAAERAAAKMGVLAEDAEGDWAALYASTGALIQEGDVRDVRDVIVREAWSVVRLDCEGGVIQDRFPASLGALNRILHEAGRV